LGLILRPCSATSAAWLVTRKGVGEQGGAGERFSIERNTAANIAGDRNSDLGLVENAIWCKPRQGTVRLRRSPKTTRASRA